MGTGIKKVNMLNDALHIITDEILMALNARIFFSSERKKKVIIGRL